MPINPDELEPKKPKEAPADLSLMSIEELKARIAMLEDGIRKCKEMIASKQSSRSSADSFFKKD